jgi:exodeoxyribonuclease VII large subunit
VSDDRPWERWLRRDDIPTDGPPDPEPPPWAGKPARSAGQPPTGAKPRVGEWAGAEGESESERRPAHPSPPISARPGRSVSRIWTVGDVTRAVRDVVRGEPAFRDLWVEGEIGQVTVSAAGHCYFTLRDGRSQLSCVFFRTQRLGSPFELRTGLRIVARGRLDVYDAAGTYQLYVESVQPAGFGDLALRFEALKARLAAEGLFDASRRRPLPPSPRVIGLATSPSGAVLHDIRHVLRRRWPLVRVVIAPCQVQGDAAPPTIVAALGRLARWRDPRTMAPPDVIILARGGGSLEDLWAFNDERVVRAVAASPVPIVTGVGHETDVTLVDFAADVRAPTPSAAAELVVPSRVEAAATLRTVRGRLDAAVERSIAGPRLALTAERRALARLHPAAVLAGERQHAGDLLDRARRAMDGRLAGDRSRLDRAADRMPLLVRGRLARARADLRSTASGLAALSPYATLERGYAIVRTPDGHVLTHASDTAAGDALDVRLARGGLDATVTGVRDSA